MKVAFTLLAERQLNELHAYISQNAGERRATTYIERILAACRSLAMFPNRGMRRDRILPGLRTIGFERRVTIAFIVEAERVVIEGIFYGGQDYESSFADDDRNK